MTQRRKSLRLEQQQKKMRQNKVMMQQQVISKRKKKTTTTTTTTTIPAPAPAPAPAPPCLTIPWLPDEVIFYHILSKLPVRSLLRFNCVSKLWYQTIQQDPNFLASHLNHSKSKPSLFAVFKDRRKLRFLHLEGEEYQYWNGAKAYSSVDLQYYPITSILGSCNGLTCAMADQYPMACDQIDIINPSTRELLAIPYPDDVQLSLPSGWKLYAGWKNYGFGFDPFMNEYKLIQFGLYSRGRAECVIYTLGTRSWRNITATSHYPQYYCPLNEVPICSSGVLLWMTLCHNILSFDVHHEIFQVIPFPHVTQGYTRHSLFELRGCPCLVYYVYDKLVDGLELRLYTLTGHHLPVRTKQQQPSSNWICEKFIVRLPLRLDTSFIRNFRVVTFSKHIFLQWINNDGLFILCNVNKSSSQKKLSGLNFTSYPGSHHVLIVNHVENLMSLKTLVPPGATGVKYVSSSEAAHESPTTPCSKRQREKQEKDRSRLLSSEGFLNFYCWFSSM